ncbi:MAG TPA: S8 family serine peptidase, partial [Pyrinomonadaceae bacterium]|nr:S8 family serine peptidase [Pyrinomonadaceae bacterium]
GAPVTSDVTNNYVYCGLAETPDQVPDSVRGKIALIARGGSVNVDQPPAPGAGTGLFSNKAAFALAKGAIAVLIFNNVDGELESATVRASTIPVMGMNKANGEFLRSLIGSTAFGAVSAKTIRLNRDKVFSPAMAAFSSRGPVQGLGQIKPDVTAPGVGVLSATVRVGSADANTGTMFDPTGYTPASGTSFSGPHVAGAAAIVKQAHLGWTPDMVRTALINTATNLRSGSGTPKADGEQADSIIAQGGGLIDTHGAVNAKALMGVAGDGITTPGILGSHSFGEMPILNNRIVNSREVTVTIRDVSGQGGTYNLSTVNSRHLDRAGISSSVSPSSVSVPAGGSATFTATITVDGDQVRDASTLDLQWYIKASRAGSGESLRMPMFLRANPSLPGASSGGAQSETVTGTVAVGDGGAQSILGVWAAEGISYDDIPVTAPAGTVRLEADLQFADIEGGLPDLDLFVFGPDGSQVAKSTNAGGPENVSIPVTQNGTYIFRVAGWVNANTNYTLTTRKFDAGAPVLNLIAADFVEAAYPGLRYSFDGSYDLTWQSTSTVDAYEIEESSDGDNWSMIRTVAGGVTSTSFTDAAEGRHIYRVRAIVPGQIGKFVTQPSNLSTIIVRKRAAVDATGSIDAVNSSITFPPGATHLTTALRNNSSTVFYPHVRFEIVSISSAGNSVRVSNADSGGDGVSAPAVFDYSQLVGYDFVPNELSGTKQLKFSNPNTVLFIFTARVMANVSTAGTSSAAGPLGEGTKAARTDTKAGSLEQPAAESTTRLLQFTVNPLTNSVTIGLL